eukprot:TRINITY_DN14748_c0_g2_i1.p1 TRINITY_DN14748_c0_g2~~TRINITY_DN14748_c0_g2_i1.p1  ORF type:complete len:578 (-),score=94.12 TRINITY_DN14748_c0_g2_i1:1681-3372(-)
MAWSRWVGLIVGVYTMLSAGTQYAFSTYGSSLKNTFNFDDSGLNLISTLFNAGGWCALLGGVVLDKAGARVTAFGGAAMSAAGYFAIFLLSKYYTSASAALVGLCCFVIGQGSSWVYCVALKVNIINFPAEIRGKIVGSLVCFFGLSGGVFTQFYNTFLDQDLQKFLFFSAIATGGLGLVTFLFCQPVPNDTLTEFEAPSRSFLPGEARYTNRIEGIYVIGATIAFAIAAFSLIEGLAPDVNSEYFGWPLIALLALFVALLIGPPIRHPEQRDEKGYLIFGPASPSTQSGEIVKSSLPQAPLADLGFPTVLLNFDFWLEFLIFTCVAGPGIVIVSNLPQLVVSREEISSTGPNSEAFIMKDLPHHSAITTLVTLFSVCSTLGRMITGYCSDLAAARGVQRSVWVVGVAVLMLAAQLLFAFAPINAMYGAIIPLGLAYGGTFCLLPTLTSEVFGVANFGGNWNLLGLAPTAGSFAFSTFLAGSLAEHFKNDSFVNIKEKKTSEAVAYCFGFDCYRYTCLIDAIVCGVGVGLSILFSVRIQAQLRRRGYAPINRIVPDDDTDIES